MQSRDGRLTFSPSDLTGYLACGHLTQLERRVALGVLDKPAAENPEAELVKRKGEEHERAYLDRLRTDGLTVAEIQLDPDLDWERAARETEEAIHRGVDVVYQGVFVDPDGWRGIADFLERQPDGTYEAVDTKLARHAKPAHVLQLCFYSEQLARIQGEAPARMHVELGSGERESHRPDRRRPSPVPRLAPCPVPDDACPRPRSACQAGHHLVAPPALPRGRRREYKSIADGFMPNADAYQMLAYCVALGIPRGLLVYAKQSGRGVTDHVIKRHGYVVSVRSVDVELEPKALLEQVAELAAEVVGSSHLAVAA